MEKEGLFMMNSFFQKRPHRKWTWSSPDGSTKNEIDFIMTTRRQLFSDVSVIKRVKTGSDHRMVRGLLNLNVKFERCRLMKSTPRPVRALIQSPETYQLELQNRFQCLEDFNAVDDINDKIVETVHAVGVKFCKTRRRRTQKLTDHTLNLIAVRREMKLQSSVHLIAYRQLNRQISKCIRRDLRNFNTARIEEAIKRNQSSKVFASDLSTRKCQLSKLKTECGSIVSEIPEILSEIERFYRQLHTSSLEPHASVSDDPRTSVIRHYSDDIPDVSLSEIRIALQHLQNSKSPGEDRIQAELLKAGGKPVLKVLQKLFTSVLHGGTTPEAWSGSAMVLFFKKGANALLKNYRAISFLSRVLFSRVITNRLSCRLIDFQASEQAGFQKGFSTIDHIHTLLQIEQKTNLPLYLAYVDYEKTFDSVEIWAVLQSLQRCQVDWRYIEVLKSLYSRATMAIRVQNQSTKPIHLQRGVRQGDITSPKLFTAALEDVFKLLDWKGYGINVISEYITHLRFADDIVLMAESLEDLALCSITSIVSPHG
ncbi:unnamed protein product [Parnassius mnemosyne]|uniref:Reverse transcriptase domain-containing protein n=1 Tax=Parnassius mnemosyne TaxID=213953 RepID=A0AAV1L5X8_9NEOP